MKRFFACVLCLTLVICIAPIQAHAEAINEIKREQILSLGCEVFPEFADKITNEICDSSVTTWSVEKPHVVYSETRTVSENKDLMYTELSNGAVLLADLTYTRDIHFDSLTNTNSGTIYKYTVSLACNYSYGVFTLANIEYIAYTAGYAYINNIGSPSFNYDDQGRSEPGTHRYIEDVSNYLPAQIIYELEFNDKNYNSSNVYCGTFIINIRSNNLTCTFDPKENAIVE